MTPQDSIWKSIWLATLLVVLWLIATIALYLSLPAILGGYGLSPLSKYSAPVKSFIFLTISLWGSQTIVALSRPILWMLANVGVLTGSDYERYSNQVKAIHYLTVWAVGIATALTAYLTQWFA